MRALFLLLLVVVPSYSNGQQHNSAASKINMVASVHPLATQAGIEAFDKGGNAIDAAIATAVTLGVVDGYNSGIGGGCFILIRSSDGTLHAIDGREMAPAAAHRDMFVKDGKPDGQDSQLGALAIGVPGALAAYDHAIKEFGKLNLADVIFPAAEIAEQGFSISQPFANRIRTNQKKLQMFRSTAEVLLTPEGRALEHGAKLRQTDLANSYRAIANHGVDWFYHGAFAKDTGKWMKANGGVMTQQDFANYRIKIRRPIKTTYRGFEIVGFPPPSSGGIHVAQILNILESFNLSKIYEDDPVQMNHVVVEAMKLAFADRAYWLGDSDFVKVPKQLVSKAYAQKLAARIDLRHASEVKSHGTPPNAESDVFEKHTTHLTAADQDGNWVAITTTINTTFGSKVIIPGTGVLMNNQMDDFAIAPSVPNAYGLIGSENNLIAPGKRPLSSMSPTIVFKNGEPILAVGAAGGPKIITQAVWAIINHLDLGMPVPQAIAQPRIHHQWSPDLIMVEETVPESMREGLRKLNHKLRVVRSSGAGVSQAIGFDSVSQMFVGAHDPRIPGRATGQ